MKNIIRQIKTFGRIASKIGLTSAISYYFQRIIKRKKKIKIFLSGLKHPLYLRPHSYDTHIFYQIFIKEDLNFNYLGTIEYIIDCGANIGLSSLWYLRKYPNAKIIAFEPEQKNFDLLKLNARPYKNIKAYKKGISNIHCKMNIIDIGDGEASYQLQSESTYTNIIGQVECLTLDEIFDETKASRFSIVKMDIEGSEKSCLLFGSLRWLCSTNNFLVELHDYIHPQVSSSVKEKLLNHMNWFVNGEYTFFQQKNIFE